MPPSRKRRVSSLFSISIHFIVSNLELYSKDPDSLTYLPLHAKDRILKKVLAQWGSKQGLNFNDVLSSLAHRNLTTIDLSTVGADDDTLKILQDCQDLQEINLRNFGNHKVSTEGLKSLFKKAKKLKILDISKISQFDDESLECLTDNCPQVFGLHVEGCNVTDDGLIYLTKKNKNLKYLTVSKTKVTGDGISAAVCNKKCLFLHELRIDDCLKVTDEVLKVVVQNCPKMEILTFYNCSITDETSLFQDITATCKNLKQLHWTIMW